MAEGPEPFIDVPQEVLDWFESGRISVLTSIEERAPGILKDRAKADEAKTRLKDLSTGSDVTVGPCCDCSPLDPVVFTHFLSRGSASRGMRFSISITGPFLCYSIVAVHTLESGRS